MRVDVRWLPAHTHATIPERTYNKDHSFLVTVATLVSIVLLIFSLRVYTRTRLLRFFGIDDCLMLGAVICAIGALVTYTSLARLGLAEPVDDVPARDIIAMGPYLLALNLMAILGISFAKLSVAFFLLRIVQKEAYRRILFVVIVLLLPLTLVWCCSIALRCIPVSAAWDPERRPRARCMSHLTSRNLGLFNGAINIASGFVFVTLPMPMFWKRIKMHNKIYTGGILSLGLVSCMAAIIRMPLIHSMWKEDDSLEHGAWLCVWTIVEMTAGITAACLPTLKPLFTTISTFFTDLTSRRQSPDPSKHEHVIDSRPSSPYAMSYSTPTFLSLPRPKPTRFHDHTSDLDFDLYNMPTQRSRTHSRNPSNLTMFSNFTIPTALGEGDGIMRPRTCSKGLVELGEDMRGFKSGYAVSVTSGSGETCEGSVESKTVKRVGSEEDVTSGGDREHGVAVVGGITKTMEVKVT